MLDVLVIDRGCFLKLIFTDARGIVGVLRPPELTIEVALTHFWRMHKVTCKSETVDDVRMVNEGNRYFKS